MATFDAIQKQLIQAQQRENDKKWLTAVKKEMEMGIDFTKGYTSPEEMLQAWQHGQNAPPRSRGEWENRLLRQKGEGAPSWLLHPAPLTQPELKETSQEPRQWNLTTVKRCVVTRQEYHHYGSVEAVLKVKGFPADGAPGDGLILISWFDTKEGCAYYELCRPVDQGELLKYMQEQFHAQPEGMGEYERAITLEGEE